MSNEQAFYELLNLACKAKDKQTYFYVMKQAEDIVRQEDMRAIAYCDVVKKMRDRLEDEAL